MSAHPVLAADVQVQVRGTVVDRAQVRRVLPDQVWLYVLIGQPAPSLPILAAQHMGNTPAADLAAHAKARLLRTGAPVLARGHALDVDRWQRQDVLRLAVTTEILPLHLPAAHHEPSSALEEAP